MVMSIKECIHILELNENYTIDELKKAYKKASFKWHPDQHYDKSDSEKEYALEMMKRVNIAYDILKSQNRKKIDYDVNNSNILRPYILVKKASLYKYINDVDINMLIEPLFLKAYKDIKSEIINFSIKDYMCVDEIDMEYIHAIKNIRDIFKRLIETYYQCYRINGEKYELDLSNKMTLDELISDLESIKFAQSSKENIETMIDLILDEYRENSFYIILLRYIDKIRDKYVDKWKYLRSINYNVFLDKMKSELEELFSIHEDNVKLVGGIKRLFDSFPRDLFDLFKENMSKKEMSLYTHIPVEVINTYYTLKDYELDYSKKTPLEINGLLSFYIEELERHGMKVDISNKTI